MGIKKKKKVIFSSDFSKLKTGFSRNAREVLLALYETGKYDIVEYACAPLGFDDEILKSVPWKAYGALPTDPLILNKVRSDPALFNNAKYGSYYIDEIIKIEKPDCYIGANDFWAFNGYYDKTWWNKVNCALWITVDSLPLLPDAIENAHKIKNFWVWSKFAEKEFHRLGFDHVQTLHAAFDVTKFKPLPQENIQELKSMSGLRDCDFYIGFVFRNQLRKLVGTLLESYSILKSNEPNTRAKLLLHTSWSEGWRIQQLANEYGVDLQDIFTTYVCPHCKNYFFENFTKDSIRCKLCNLDGATTPKTYLGVTEEQMNEIYNCMDYYVQPVTSGGLEMPVVEAMMAGIPCAIPNYSCGEEYCDTNLVDPIGFNFYREFGTQFLKSQPDPRQFAELLHKASIGNLKDKSSDLRQWAKQNYDVKQTSKWIQDWIDNCPEVDHSSYSILRGEDDSKYFPDESIKDDYDWCIDLVEGVFGYQESKFSSTIKNMVNKLNSGDSREKLIELAHKAADESNEKKRKLDIKNFFSREDETSSDQNNNVALIAPVELPDKLILGGAIKKIINKNEKLFIVGDEFDMDIFSQSSNFKLIPRTQSTQDPAWLLSLKNEIGAKRFSKVFFFKVNEFCCITNS